MPDGYCLRAKVSALSSVMPFVSPSFPKSADEQDEFCFLVHSQGISIVVHGHCSDESGPERIYQCVGSIDPHLVKRAFEAMIPHWQFIDLPEANRLDDARGQVGNPVTAPHFVKGIRHDWPVVKQRSGPGAAAVDPEPEPSPELRAELFLFPARRSLAREMPLFLPVQAARCNTRKWLCAPEQRLLFLRPRSRSI